VRHIARYEAEWNARHPGAREPGRSSALPILTRQEEP
jgi:hypothetical protein